MRREKGAHTWDIYIHYHRCPSCGFIIESRNPYQYRQGKYYKDLTCPRCRHAFTDYSEKEPSIGPIFGEETPPEFDWT